MPKIKKYKMHDAQTERSADIEYISSSGEYKITLYPGDEVYLPHIDFFETHEEAMEAANKWIGGTSDYGEKNIK